MVLLRRALYLLAFVLLGTASCWSQTSHSSQNTLDQNKGILYNSEWALEPRLHTNGFSLGLLFGQLNQYNKTSYRKIDIGYLRHPREHVQQSSPSNGNQGFRRYTYGKINQLFVLRLSMGKKRYLSEKDRRKGIALGYSYEVGGNLGFLMPYYLRLVNSNPDIGTQIESVKYDETIHNDFLDPRKIAGRGGLFEGLGESSIRPGLSGRISAHMAWGAYEKNVTALEVGLMLDLYFSQMPLTAADENQNYFLNVFVAFQLGRRS